ncbi:MAG: transcription termination factor Rho, partial [Eubacteriales bacterium]|nr:transcription termination factor Rho [Eubacteriales bacterium]
MRERYESLSLVSLKELAKARGLKGISTLRKPALIERMLEEDAREEQEKAAEVQDEVQKPESASDTKEEEQAPKRAPERIHETNQSRPPIRTYSSYNRNYSGGSRSYGNNENRSYG